MKMNKFKLQKKKKEIQETKLHAILRFAAEIICGPHRGSFADRDHLRSSLGNTSSLHSFGGKEKNEKKSKNTKNMKIDYIAQDVTGHQYFILSINFRLRFPVL